MRITTVRHGETDWNVARRAQGSKDIELNQNGINQAQLLAERLANEPCDIIYSSDLKRAYKTAEIINNRHHVPLIATPELRESSFGKFEGAVLSDFETRKAFSEFAEQRAPAYFAQVHAYLGKIISHSDKDIIIVAHYGTVRAMVCYFLNIPVAQRGMYAVGNTAIHTFERLPDGSFRMVLENDTGHLN
ncbi:MAG: histidine phosphatase family protein [Defluviitaleaceae bacterium]|nr:histidine phosphatase family protein [Defluviitaleaceae bacterium]